MSSDAGSALEVESLGDNGRTVSVRVSGELDYSTIEALRSEFDRIFAVRESVELDLLQVTFVDSCGLRALIEPLAEGRHVSIIRASEGVVRLLDLTALRSLLGPSDENGGRAIGITSA